VSSHPQRPGPSGESRGTGITSPPPRLDVAGENLLDAPCPELIVRFRFADPNREPRGMTLEEASQYKKASDFDIGVRWVEPIVIRSDDWAEHFEAPVAWTRATRRPTC
jgi:hypothetical protein